MSAVIKPKRFKKLPAATPVLWVVLGLAAAFFLVRYGQEVLSEHDLNSQIAAQRVANSNLTDDNARLQAALQYFQSDKYIEQRAREELNLRRPDEEVLIPIGDQSQPVAGTSSPAGQAAGQANRSAEATPTADEPNWQKWLDLFSPFSDSSP
jgi:cell division protein FtsB